MNRVKRALFEAALLRGKVQVTIIAVPGLDVPPAARIDGTVLEYGYDMPKPIPDLEVTDAGISASLSFKQQPCKTFVPWPAVVKMAQEGGFVSLWPVEVEHLRCVHRAVA